MRPVQLQPWCRRAIIAALSPAGLAVQTGGAGGEARDYGRSGNLPLAEAMLRLQQRLAAAKTDQDRVPLQRQVAETDREIDRLVYDLYGLTEDEIRLVERR